MPSSSSVAVAGDSLENRFFKITVDPQTGAVASIYDKELARELVDRNAPHKLNQFVARWVQSGRLESPAARRSRRGRVAPCTGAWSYPPPAPVARRSPRK